MIDLLAPRGRWGREAPLADRIEFGDCWEWQGARDPNGYGRINNAGGSSLVHRAVYESLVGPIEDDLPLHHMCINPPCCNPDHLIPTTHAENVRQAKGNLATKRGMQTHCINGHRLEGVVGKRRCRVCYNAWNRKRRLNDR